MVRGGTPGAFKSSLVAMGVILDEPMLIAHEGVEGEAASPTRLHPVSNEDTSNQF